MDVKLKGRKLQILIFACWQGGGKTSKTDEYEDNRAEDRGQDDNAAEDRKKRD